MAGCLSRLRERICRVFYTMKVNFMGNLGNQMFCYAFGRSLSLARGIPLYFDRSHVDSLPTILSYSMDAYDLDIQFGGPDGPLYQERDLPFDLGVYTASENSVFNGNWQTEKYFNPEVVRKDLGRPKGEPNDSTKRMAEVLTDCIFVHVRRGDYTNPDKNEFHGCQTADYYLKSMRYIEEHVDNAKFFIFSDDPSWCRQVFQQKNMTVVSYNQAAHTSRQA